MAYRGRYAFHVPIHPLGLGLDKGREGLPVPPEHIERKLAAILAADVSGYSRLMSSDEEGTLMRLKSHRRELIDPKITEHNGRIVKTTGDGLLVEFASVVDAMRCAVEVQRGMADRNSDVPTEKRIEFRVGINVGDIIIDDDDILGDGVNVAARLEGLADPGGICVSGRVYEDTRGKIDIAFEDTGEQQLKNIVWPVRVFRAQLSGTAGVARPALARSDKPSVAVLPFQNMSGDPEQEYFSDGITEDIITALSKHRSLLVIARNSTFAFKGQGIDIRLVGTKLGADYIIEGGVRKMGERIRITAQLIETEGGRHLWAERYDRNLDDIFEVQDEIVATIAARIEPEVSTAELRRAEKKPPATLRAWDLLQLGKKHLYRSTAEDNLEAQRLFRHAIELDPELAEAHAYLSYALVLGMTYFEADPDDGRLHDVVAIARQAVELDDQDALIRFIYGRALVARGAYAHALSELQTAVELNPNLAVVHCGLADALAYEGRFAEAMPFFHKAIELSPYDPQRWAFYSYRALAHLLAREFDQAVEWANKAVLVPRCHYWPLAHRVSALGYLQTGNELAPALNELLQRKPHFSCGFARRRLFYLKNPVDLDTYVEGLRRAGLPE